MKLRKNGHHYQPTQFGLKPLDAMVRRLYNSKAALFLVSCTLPMLSSAGPIGEDVIAGNAAINRPDASATIIEQFTPKTIINWQQFSIDQGEQVQFIQPDSSAIALNRVIGGSPSAIFGQLNANGQVFLVNTHGIYFGPGASADVAGLVASALGISNQDFLNDNFYFSNNNSGNNGTSVDNAGTLTAADGGYIVLTGESVNNDGIITARLGEVALASGRAVTMTTDPTGLISMVVDEAAMSAGGINNHGTIAAAGGRIFLTASLAEQLAATAVNNSGMISAKGITEANGEIYLTGSGGQIINSGDINADATNNAQAGLISIRSNNDITLDANSRLSASGAQAQADGGEIRIIADGTLLMKQAAEVSVDGGLLGGNGGFLELSGKQRIALNGQYSGRAQVSGYRDGSLYIDPQNIRIINGGTALSGGTATASSGSAASTLDVDPNMNNIGWSDVTLNALLDISIIDPITDTSIPVGGSLNLLAGQDIHVRNNIGQSLSRFNHSLRLSAGRNIDLGLTGSGSLGIYLGGTNNTLDINADTNADGIGSILLTGNNNTSILADGTINLSGAGLQVSGGNNAFKRIVGVGDINIALTNDMTITGGNIAAASSGDASAIISAGQNISISITTGDLLIQGGNAHATSGASADASSSINASGNITIDITSGSLNVQGGVAIASIGTTASSSAFADASADLSATGGLSITAGTMVSVSGGSASASINGFSSSSLIADATANATIQSGNTSNLTITSGTLNIDGGFAAATAIDNSSFGSSSITAIATANADLTGQNVSVALSSNLNVRGGTAEAMAGATSSGTGIGSASADATISAINNVDINLSTTGSLAVTGGSAKAAAIFSNSSFSGTGDAYVDASATINGNQQVNITGAQGITVSGGTATNSGNWANTSASAASFNSTAKANATLSAATGTLNITASGSLAVRGGSTTNAITVASSSATSGLGIGSASASAKAAVFSSGNATISVTGGVSWVGGGSQVQSLIGGTAQQDTRASITGNQLNLSADALYINSDGDITLPTSAQFTIGSGTIAEATGDSRMLSTLTNNLLQGPSTTSPSLKIVSSGILAINSVVTMTGTNPYIWLKADNTTFSQLILPNAQGVTLQYSPYSINSTIGIEQTLPSAPSYTPANVNYYSDVHFNLTAALGNNANIIIGGSEQIGIITAGQGGGFSMGGQNIGLLTTADDDVVGENLITSTGTVFTFKPSYSADLVAPLLAEIDPAETLGAMTYWAEQKQQKYDKKPLIIVSTQAEGGTK